MLKHVVAGTVLLIGFGVTFASCGGDDLVVGGTPRPTATGGAATPTPECTGAGGLCTLGSDCCSGQCLFNQCQ